MVRTFISTLYLSTIDSDCTRLIKPSRLFTSLHYPCIPVVHILSVPLHPPHWTLHPLSSLPIAFLSVLLCSVYIACGTYEHVSFRLHMPVFYIFLTLSCVFIIQIDFNANQVLSIVPSVLLDVAGKSGKILKLLLFECLSAAVFPHCSITEDRPHGHAPASTNHG